MRRLAAGVLVLSLLSGCSGGGVPYAREMGDMALLRTMGLDIADGGVQLTVSTDKRDGERGALVLSGRGLSAAGAALAVQALGDSYVYYGHVDQLLLGEELAVQGVGPVLDYLAREPQLGLGMDVWVVQGATAADAVLSGGEGGVARRLGQMGTDSQMGAGNIGCTAVRLMSALAAGRSICLPVLTLEPARQGDGGTEQQTLLPGGYAVIREGKLVCYLQGDKALGVELLEEKAAGHVADVDLADGTQVSLKVTKVRVDCSPVFQGGELIGAAVVCRLSARVAQSDRALTQEQLQEAGRKLELMEGERMVSVLERSQYWDADFLGLKQRVQMACPREKERIGEVWREVFRSLALTVEVTGVVERSTGVIRVGVEDEQT